MCVLSLVDIHCQSVGIHCDAIAKVDSSFARLNFKIIGSNGLIIPVIIGSNGINNT